MFYFELYDPVTGNFLGKVESINFGEILQGQHNTETVLFKLRNEDHVGHSTFKLYLESKGNWASTIDAYAANEFLYIKPGIGDDLPSSVSRQRLIETPGAEFGSSNGFTVLWVDRGSPAESQFIWLDCQIPSSQLGITEANFRFIME